MGAPQSQRQPEVPGARGRILRIGILLGGIEHERVEFRGASRIIFA